MPNETEMNLREDEPYQASKYAYYMNVVICYMKIVILYERCYL